MSNLDEIRRLAKGEKELKKQKERIELLKEIRSDYEREGRAYNSPLSVLEKMSASALFMGKSPLNSVRNLDGHILAEIRSYDEKKGKMEELREKIMASITNSKNGPMTRSRARTLKATAATGGAGAASGRRISFNANAPSNKNSNRNRTNKNTFNLKNILNALNENMKR